MLENNPIENTATKVPEENHSKTANFAKMRRRNSEKNPRIEQGEFEAYPTRASVQTDHDHE